MSSILNAAALSWTPWGQRVPHTITSDVSGPISPTTLGWWLGLSWAGFMLYSVQNFLSIIWILFKPLTWLFKRFLFRGDQINEFDVEDHYLHREMRRRHPPEDFQSLTMEDPTERDQHRNMSGRSDEVIKTSYRPAYNYHYVIGFRNWPICIVRRREPLGAVLTERYTCVWTLGKRSTLLIDFIEDCGQSYRQSRGQLIEVYRPQNKSYWASRSPGVQIHRAHLSG